MSAALQPLSGLDALFLHLETPEMPMHVGSLSLLAPPARFRGDFTQRVRELIGSRLHLAAPFTRRLATLPLDLANPLWIRVHPDDIDLHRHIRRETLPAPGSLAQLHALVGRLHGQRLDRSRPLWELTVIDGLGGRWRGHVGYYAKVHHAAIDGQAGVALARAMLDTTARPRRVDPPAQAPRTTEPTQRELLAAAARNGWTQLARLPALVPVAARSAGRALAQALAGWQHGSGSEAASAGGGSLQGRRGLLGPRTPLNGAVSAQRAFATLSLPLAQMKATAAALGVTVNDLLLAICAGALREWLAAHGGVPDRPLWAAVPFTLRGSGEDGFANRVSMMRAQLATHLADPSERLAAIHASMASGKRLAGAVREVVPTDYPSLGAPWLLSGLAAVIGRSPLAAHVPTVFNVAVSNVPGPPAELYLAGARVVSYWPASIVVHGVALNITAQSYAQRMEFGLTACAQAVPDLPRLATRLAAAFGEYARLAGVQRAPARRRRSARPQDATAAPPGPGTRTTNITTTPND
jgi:diacylglycerol O-acyltransferase